MMKLVLFIMLSILCINNVVVASESPSPSPSHYHHQPPQTSPLTSPSHAQAPSPQMLEHYHHETPSASPSQPPEMPSQYYNEPPSSSPSPSPSPPPPHHSFRPPPPTPSPVSPPPNNGPGSKPPPSSQCWSEVMAVNGCTNEIIMAYHGYSRNIKPSCCQAINRTSRNCLFDMLFFRTHNTYFILWLQEHCARVAHA